MPPNAVHMDHEQGKSHVPQATPLGHTATILAIDPENRSPVVSKSSGANIPSTAKAPNGRGIIHQYAMFLEFDEDLVGAGGSQHSREKVKRARVSQDGQGK
jgi:hypothetical protein